MPKETRRFTNWLTYQLKKNVSYVGWVIVVLYLAYIHEDNKRQQYFQNQARGNAQRARKPI